MASHALPEHSDHRLDRASGVQPPHDNRNAAIDAYFASTAGGVKDLVQVSYNAPNIGRNPLSTDVPKDWSLIMPAEKSDNVSMHPVGGADVQKELPAKKNKFVTNYKPGTGDGFIQLS